MTDLMVYIALLEQQEKYADALEILCGNLGSLLPVEVDRLQIQVLLIFVGYCNGIFMVNLVKLCGYKEYVMEWRDADGLDILLALLRFIHLGLYLISLCFGMVVVVFNCIY